MSFEKHTTSNPTVLIVGASHGNELLGVKLYERMLRKRLAILEQIDFIIGNPRAFATKKRYIESDINRSYGITSPEGYEELRAREITTYINKTKPSLVLDMHTTVCDQPPCLIMHNLEGEMKRRYLRGSHVDKILQIKPLNDIASLGDNIIGYEVSNRDINLELLDNIITDLENFICGLTVSKTKRVFIMKDKIFKKDVTDEIVKTFVNFEMHSLGFVPIMTGSNNSYKQHTDYLGFKADSPKEIRI